MKKIIFIYFPLLLFAFNISCRSQSLNAEASFPGGKEQLDLYFSENMEWRQSQLTIQGKVYIKFLVNKKGKIKNISVVKGLCDSCDLEAKRLVKSMPDWIPAKKGRTSIDSEVVIPISFNIK